MTLRKSITALAASAAVLGAVALLPASPASAAPLLAAPAQVNDGIGFQVTIGNGGWYGDNGYSDRHDEARGWWHDRDRWDQRGGDDRWNGRDDHRGDRHDEDRARHDAGSDDRH